MTYEGPRRIRQRSTGEADAQRQAVYRWGWAMPEWKQELTLDDCRALVARVWSEYRPGATVPEVTDGRGTRGGWAFGRYRISLARNVRNPVAVLHEVAHTLLPDDTKHSPVFATLMLQLLARYARVDKAAARRAGIEQKPRRVHFARESEVPQPKGREYLKWARERRVLEQAVVEARAALTAHDSKRPRR